MAACPELPKEAASSGFHPPPQTLAALLAGPLEAKNAFQPAKVGLRLRNSGSVGDALTDPRSDPGNIAGGSPTHDQLLTSAGRLPAAINQNPLDFIHHKD